MKTSLLLVEDDVTIRETIRDALQLEGFEVTSCANGLDALQKLLVAGEQAPSPYALVVLDLMLPGLGGLELCRRVRQHDPLTPILVVSARDSEADRVLGLEVGADDYLIKPFGLRELVARCRALLRRSGSSSSRLGKLLKHANLRLYPDECRVLCDGQEINLSPKEYQLLELFMLHPGQIWSREKLLDKIWGYDFFCDSKTVDVHIHWLRKKVEADPSRPAHLVTVRGFGYRFG